MVRILEYAQGEGRAWRQVRRWVVSICALVPIIMVALLNGAQVYADWRSTRVTPEKAVWMWTFLYNGSAFVLERKDGRTVFELQVLGTTYHVVQDRAAALTADAAAQYRVRDLVKFLDGGEKSSPRTSARFADELAVLTGQDFGEDAAAWQHWTDVHLGEVKGGWETYERLAELRRRAGEKAGEPWGFDRQDAAIRAAYEQRMSHFWGANWWRIALVIVCGGACVRVIAWARQPGPALLRAGRL
jgi:hypothetical protein